MTRSDARLKVELDGVLARYQRVEFLSTDPISIPHRYRNPQDQEMVGFFAAMMAFGNVRSMLQAIEKALAWMGDSPLCALQSASDADIEEATRGHLYRWVRASDLAAFFRCMKRVYAEHGSLENLFARGCVDHEETTLPGLHTMLEGIRSCIEPVHLGAYGTRYLLPPPHKTSAYKRAHLFLRWMIRKDAVDFGLWRAASASQCLMPLDTHVARLSRLLGLSSRKSIDSKMVLEVTAALRQISPDDPVKYDFALSRLGILGACPRKPVDEVCAPCDLRRACTHWTD